MAADVGDEPVPDGGRRAGVGAGVVVGGVVGGVVVGGCVGSGLVVGAGGVVVVVLLFSVQVWAWASWSLVRPSCLAPAALTMREMSVVISVVRLRV